MPLKLRKTTAPRTLGERIDQVARAGEATRKPTLEELRKKHELGTLERVKVEAVEYGNLKIKASEATNAANRQKTQIKKAVKMVMRQEELGPLDRIGVGDEEYSFDVTHSEKVSLDKFFKLYKDGKITEEQFKGSITVLKSEAELRCGAHIVNLITTTEDGKTADVRVKPAEKEYNEPVIIRHKPKLEEKPVSPPRPISATATAKRPGNLRTKRILAR